MQQAELAFLDDPANAVTIRFDANEWEFCYPIGELEIVEEEEPEEVAAPTGFGIFNSIQKNPS